MKKVKYWVRKRLKRRVKRNRGEDNEVYLEGGIRKEEKKTKGERGK